MSFLVGRVLLFGCAESVGRIELVLVPGEPNTEREIGTVFIRPRLLKNIELRAGHLRQFGSFRERSVRVPQCGFVSAKCARSSERGQSQNQQECGYCKMT